MKTFNCFLMNGVMVGSREYSKSKFAANVKANDKAEAEIVFINAAANYLLKEKIPVIGLGLSIRTFEVEEVNTFLPIFSARHLLPD